MKQHLYLLFFYLMLSIILAGCTSVRPNVPKELDISFQKIISIEDMNGSIRIRQTSLETAKYGSNITVSIENLSNQPIFFPLNFGIRLFIIRDNEWIEIQDKNQYYGEGTLLHSKNHEDYSGKVTTWIRPVLPPELKSDGNHDILRILVIGETQGGGIEQGVLVGAYYDVDVYP